MIRCVPKPAGLAYGLTAAVQYDAHRAAVPSGKRICVEGFTPAGRDGHGFLHRFRWIEAESFAVIAARLDLLAQAENGYAELARPRPGVTPDRFVRRLINPQEGADATLEEAPRTLLFLDIDGADPFVLDLLAPEPERDGEAGMRRVLDLLGLAGVPAWAQFTSKMRPDGSNLRARIIAPLDRAYALAELVAWGEEARAFSGLDIDLAILGSRERVIYTAPPVTVNVAGEEVPDPISRRIFRFELDVPTAARLDVPANWQTRERRRWRERAPAAPRTGWDPLPYPLPSAAEALAAIGDHAGGLGRDGGVIWAIRVLARHGLDRATILARVQAAARAAVWDPAVHPLAAVEEKITESNLRRLLDYVSGHGRGALIEGVAPPDAPAEVSLERGQEIVSETIRRFVAEGGRVLLRGALGIGKTTAALAAVKDAPARFAFASTDLAEEKVADAARRFGLTGHVVRGRDSETPDGPHALDDLPLGEEAADLTPERMCLRSKLAALAMDRLGADSVGGLICFRRGARCPLSDRCKYLAQGEPLRSALVGAYQHAHLAAPQGFIKDVRRDREFVDEAPWSKLIQKRFHKIEVVAEAVPDLAEALHRHRERWPGEIGEAARFRIGAWADRTLAEVWHAGDPAWMTGLLTNMLSGSNRTDLRFLARVVRDALDSESATCNSVWIANQFINVVRKSAHLHEHTIVMDGTARPALAEVFLPGLEVVDVPVRTRAHVTQVWDRSFADDSLLDKEGRPTELLGEVARWIERLTAGGKTLGVISTVPVETVLRQLLDPASQPEAWEVPVHPRTGGRVFTGHYGNLRGTNRFENVDALVCIGRCQPPVHGMEEEARALWPHEELTFTGTYEWAPAGYRLRDGRRCGVLVHAHRDPRIDLVLRTHREDELEQAVGRARALRRDVPVFILGKTPTAVPVDVLVRWPDLSGPPVLREVMERTGGVFPLDPGVLRRAARGVCKDKEAAEYAARAVKEWLSERVHSWCVSAVPEIHGECESNVHCMCTGKIDGASVEGGVTIGKDDGKRAPNKGGKSYSLKEGDPTFIRSAESPARDGPNLCTASELSGSRTGAPQGSSRFTYSELIGLRRWRVRQGTRGRPPEVLAAADLDAAAVRARVAPLFGESIEVVPLDGEPARSDNEHVGLKIRKKELLSGVSREPASELVAGTLRRKEATADERDDDQGGCGGAGAGVRAAERPRRAPSAAQS